MLVLKFQKWTKDRDYKYKDTLLMLESLPAKETRNYIKLVLTNLWVYKARFNQDNTVLFSLASGKSIDSKVFFKIQEVKINMAEKILFL